MKKMMTCLLAALLMLTAVAGNVSFAYAQEYLAAQAWYATEIGDIDQNDAMGPTYASAYYGLWTKTVSKDAKDETLPTYEIAFYTPETWVAAGGCVYVVAPNGYTAEQFANAGAWMQVAYDYGITVAFLAPQDGGAWDLDNLEDTLDYVIATSVEMSARSIVNYNESSLYIVGYGEGSTVANYAAMNLANMFAGAVLMGTPDIGADAIEAIGNDAQFASPLYGDYTRKEGTALKGVNIPVWIVNDGDANGALEAYWKAANDVSDEIVYNEYATIYSQDLLFVDPQAEYEATSYVWISEIDDAAEKLDYEFTAYMWDSFLCKLLRLRAKQDGTLYYNSVDQIGALEYFSTTINGVDRYWAVYTPASYDGAAEMPMVLFVHGHAHGIAGFFVNAGTWRQAEKYGFVLVYALGDPCSGHKNVDCYTWVSNPTNDNFPYEIEYFTTVLDSVTADYSIDTTRIYCTSHSAGSGMANRLAEVMPERFAGFAPVGAPGALYRTMEAYAEAADEPTGIASAYIVQYAAAEPEYSAEKVQIQVTRAMQNSGMDMDTVGATYDTGDYVETFYTTEGGLPLVKSVVWADRTHTYLPEYFDMAWDQLSGYSRGADGTLYFDGVAVK